jgi:hypothetical protein
MKQTTKRAITLPVNSVGHLRQNLYKNAIEKFHLCMRNAYYIEGISICSGMISDRLESRLFQLTAENEGFKPLNILIEEVLHLEKDHVLSSILSTELKSWKRDRDICLDDLVKCQEGKEVLWETREAVNQKVAMEGFELFRKIDKRIRSLSRYRKR